MCMCTCMCMHVHTCACMYVYGYGCIGQLKADGYNHMVINHMVMINSIKSSHSCNICIHIYMQVILNGTNRSVGWKPEIDQASIHCLIESTSQSSRRQHPPWSYILTKRRQSEVSLSLAHSRTDRHHVYDNNRRRQCRLRQPLDGCATSIIRAAPFQSQGGCANSVARGNGATCFQLFATWYGLKRNRVIV